MDFFCRFIKDECPLCIVLLYCKRDYAASSMKAPRRLDFFAPLPTFIVIFQPIHTKLDKLYTRSLRMNHTIYW